MIKLKLAYDEPSPDDGFRILVERSWPRDLKTKHGKLDLWLKSLAPSTKLHAQFGETPTPEQWEEFQALYTGELRNKRRSIKLLEKKSKEGNLTIVHAAHHPEHSAAAVLKRFLESPASRAKQT